MRPALIRAITILLLLGVLDAQDGPPRIIVAAEISPGSLYPIGRFVEGRWLDTWPPPVETPDRRTPGRTASPPLPSLDRLPLEWLGGPAPRQWTLHHRTGAATAITIEGLRRGDGGCVDPLEIVFSPGGAVPAPVPAEWLPIGLATAASLPIEGFRRVTTGPEYDRVNAAIEELYRAREPSLMSQIYPSWREAALKASATSPRGLTLRWFSRPAGDTTPLVYYFEARRPFAGSESVLGLKISGWLRRGADGSLEPMSVEGGMFGTDSAESGGSEVRLPRGVLQIGRRTFWIMSVSGYESFGFRVYELTDRGMEPRLSASHGGC